MNINRYLKYLNKQSLINYNKYYFTTTNIKNDEDVKLQNRIAVKNLYKQLLFLGRVGFLGVDYIRDRAKPQFIKNENLTDQEEITKCIDRTKYVIKEIEAMNRFHKYRSLKKSYDPEFQKINDDFLNKYNDNDNDNKNNNK